jgi:hypothetical protein
LEANLGLLPLYTPDVARAAGSRYIARMEALTWHTDTNIPLSRAQEGHEHVFDSALSHKALIPLWLITSLAHVIHRNIRNPTRLEDTELGDYCYM